MNPESNPPLSNRQPIRVSLEKGRKYFYCTCGLSKTQPFCDGSHAGTGKAPHAFVAEKDGDAWLCQCKQTGNAPFCDGTHSKLAG